MTAKTEHPATYETVITATLETGVETKRTYGDPMPFRVLALKRGNRLIFTDGTYVDSTAKTRWTVRRPMTDAEAEQHYAFPT